ncbi:LOW QUALITY PROTEIN: uncharacterized protein LOC105832435, partial [Monomorium pharaonis]|uniref:LOW QUALITY PROTEIN: uncharacterized protein LOC105832435 n=1 Tax=Monomorium pharaonis TaxID=307658 RepID=UPI0017471D7C
SACGLSYEGTRVRYYLARDGYTAGTIAFSSSCPPGLTRKREFHPRAATADAVVAVRPSVIRRETSETRSTVRFLTELPTEDAACRSSRNVSDKLDIGSVPIGEEFPGTLQIFQSRRTLTTTCLTSLWTPTLGR